MLLQALLFVYSSATKIDPNQTYIYCLAINIYINRIIIVTKNVRRNASQSHQVEEK